MAKKAKAPLPVEDEVVNIRTWTWKSRCLFCKEEIATPYHGAEVRCSKCMRFFRVHTRRDSLNGSVAYWGLIPIRDDECFMCKMGVIEWEGSTGRCIHCKQDWVKIGTQKQICPTNMTPSPEVAELIRRRKES